MTIDYARRLMKGGKEHYFHMSLDSERAFRGQVHAVREFAAQDDMGSSLRGCGEVLIEEQWYPIHFVMEGVGGSEPDGD